MASAFIRNKVTGRTAPGDKARKKTLSKDERWYARYKDASGGWKSTPIDAKNYGDALEQARALEAVETVKRTGKANGLAPDQTFGEMTTYWLKQVSVTKVSHVQDESRINNHLSADWFKSKRAADITRGDIERLLLDRETAGGLAPASVNHLRTTLSRIFEDNIRLGQFAGPNPVVGVKKRKVPSRLPNYLQHHEVRLLLDALPDRWNSLFATAIYTGLRKGELLGLEKRDVDLENGRIDVRHSHGRDTTKSGQQAAVRIPTELKPFLQTALRASKTALVFPAPSGERMREDFALQDVLHRAMVKAGLVEGYRHKCRKKGCGHIEHHADATTRRCPEHGMKLWPSAMVRPLRFHDLRHTTASLMVMAGANIVSVSKHLRHADPVITAKVYAHLSPDFQQSEVDRLTFFPTLQAEEPVRQVVGGEDGLVSGLSREDENAGPDGQKAAHNTLNSEGVLMARDAGFEPATLGFGGQYSIQLS